MKKEVGRRKRGFSERASDATTSFFGSWIFVSSLAIIIVIWITLNVTGILGLWDEYPFILLNLVLSTLAAIQVPLILMSQNRTAQRDRTKAERDFAVDRKAEREIRDMQKDLDEIKNLLRKKK